MCFSQSFIEVNILHCVLDKPKHQVYEKLSTQLFSVFVNVISILNKIEAQQYLQRGEFATLRHSIHLNWTGSTGLVAGCSQCCRLHEQRQSNAVISVDWQTWQVTSLPPWVFWQNEKKSIVRKIKVKKIRTSRKMKLIRISRRMKPKLL